MCAKKMSLVISEEGLHVLDEILIHFSLITIWLHKLRGNSFLFIFDVFIIFCKYLITFSLCFFNIQIKFLLNIFLIKYHSKFFLSIFFYLHMHLKINENLNLLQFIIQKLLGYFSYKGKEKIIVYYIYSGLPKLFERHSLACNTMRSDTSNSVLSKP